MDRCIENESHMVFTAFAKGRTWLTRDMGLLHHLLAQCQ